MPLQSKELIQKLRGGHAVVTLWGYTLGAKLEDSVPPSDAKVTSGGKAIELPGREVLVFPADTSSPFLHVLANESGDIEELQLLPSPIDASSFEKLFSPEVLTVLTAPQRWDKELGGMSETYKKQIVHADEHRPYDVTAVLEANETRGIFLCLTVWESYQTIPQFISFRVPASHEDTKKIVDQRLADCSKQ